MLSTLFTAGIACIIAAIVGGGLKTFGIEIPLLQSVPRQLLLGAFGGILLILSFVVTTDIPSRSSQNHSESSPYTEKGQTDTDRQDSKVIDSKALRDHFQSYYSANDKELKELSIRLIREQLAGLAGSNGNTSEHIENADIKELERIATSLGAL